jgi:hypothetical protein
MKKTFYFLVSLLVISVLFNSCNKDDFDEALLYSGAGIWKSGTLHYKYLSNGKGASWDTKDDVKEDEAQPFTWTLVKSELRHLHQHFGGGSSPENFTVKKLTATTLECEDVVDKRKYTFTKVN